MREARERERGGTRKGKEERKKIMYLCGESKRKKERKKKIVLFDFCLFVEDDDEKEKCFVEKFVCCWESF